MLSSIVIFLQWILTSPYELVRLSENGKDTQFIFNKKEHYLSAALDEKTTPFKIPVVRYTEKTIHTLTAEGKKGYLYHSGFATYNLVQESKVKYTTPKKVAILYISTGKYITFWKNFYNQMEKHFLPRHEKTYFLFTDHDDLVVPKNVVKVHQDQLPWPYVTFKRYHFFESIEKELSKFDYIYFLNGTMLPVQDVNEDIFPTKEQEVMVTLHPGYMYSYNYGVPYDGNLKSKAFVDPGYATHYFMGGFNGGTGKGFLKLTKTIREWTDIDIKNGVMPAWHDESMLNAYMVQVMQNGLKPLILMSEYAIPESSKGWHLDDLFPYTKMIVIDKGKHGGHSFLRGQDQKEK